jgi:hypothetical protein
MPTSHRKVVSIKQKPEQKTLSKAQKQFNALIKKIDAQKKLLTEWKETLPVYQKKVAEEYEVLTDTYDVHRIELARLLDRAHDDSLFKKRDKDKIRHIISDITEALVHDHSEAVKDLYNKYNHADYDTEAEEFDALAGDFMKAMAQDLFDLDIPDDVDMRSPEKMQAVLQEKMREKMANEAEQHRQAQENISKRKKTPKQLEREAKQEQEAENISKSIQEVYRKLVRTLHPDREQDDNERERKTELMQRVNTAYGKKDLLQLLELQLEIEQIDQSQLNNIAEDRLKYFNQILKEQLDELVQEITEIEFPFKMNMSFPSHMPLHPSVMMRHLQIDIQSLKNDVRRLKADVDLFKDFAYLKRWLRDFKVPKRDTLDEMDELMFGDFSALFK